MFRAQTGTATKTVALPQVPSMTTLFIDFSATGSVDIKLRDSEAMGYITVRTVTADSIVRIAIPATDLAVQITANTGTVTITYRIVVVDNLPDTAIEVFSGGGVSGGAPIIVSGELTTKRDTYKKLAQVQPGIAIATVYTVPAGTQTQITHIVVTNTTGVNRTIALYHDGSVAANNILPTSTVVAGGFAEFTGEVLMESGDTLQAIADAATALTLTVYGREILNPT